MQSNQAQQTPQVGDLWYRYIDQLTGSVDEWGEICSTRVSVHCRTYVVCKTTPRGVWVLPYYFLEDVNAQSVSPSDVKVPQGNPRDAGARLVLLDSGKQFASPTKARALDGYLARKKCQVRIYTARLKNAQDALSQATAMKAQWGLDEKRAWALYCQETAAGADVRDFWEELSPTVQALYLQKVRNPIAQAA